MKAENRIKIKKTVDGANADSSSNKTGPKLNHLLTVISPKQTGNNNDNKT